MSRYFTFFRIRFIRSLQYRADAAAGICTQFAWGFMGVLLYRAFYQTDPASFPMDFQALASYLWLQQAFLALYMTWFWDMDLFRSIENGNVAYELCRPVSLYGMWFTKLCALRLSRALLRCFPILLVAALLPRPFGLSAPADPAAACFFLFSMLLAFGVVTAFNMVIYGMSFFTLSSRGLRMMASQIADLFCGSVIPLPFFPDGLRQAAELLPFGSMGNAAFRIYSGDISGVILFRTLGLQIFWLLFLLLLGRFLFSRAVSRMILQGG